MAIRLSSPLLRLVLGNPQDPDSWQEVTVQTLTPDVVNAESELARTKRGPATEHPLLAMIAAAYFALMRTGQGVGSLPDFERQCLDVDVIDQEAVDPTQPDPVAG